MLLASLAWAAEMEHDPGEPDLLETTEMRTASGTAWQPEATPMHGLMGSIGDFEWMAHANVFGVYDWQASERGDAEFGSVNWVMAGIRRPVGQAELGARAMLSLEPLTLGADGYPLVGQTGETLDGEPLTDRQHPHDLFMETALIYRQALGNDVGYELYVAPAGEPAVGPVAFPHRSSAISDPIAPLSHHWQDSTHISYGVVTAGVFTRFGKIEGSWFNGREPDENRWGFDLAVPDSAACRVTVAPTKAVSGQLSYAYLANPEVLHPGAVHRVTASLTANRALAGEGNWATTAVWGRNYAEGEPTDSALVESGLSVGRHVNLFGRAEYVVKTGEELALVDERARYGIGAVSLGHVYTVEAIPSWMVGLGVRGGLTALPAGLAEEYGTRLPASAMVYLQARPAEHEMGAHTMGMGHH